MDKIITPLLKVIICVLKVMASLALTPITKLVTDDIKLIMASAITVAHRVKKLSYSALCIPLDNSDPYFQLNTEKFVPIIAIITRG